MPQDSFVQSQEFLNYLADWLANLPELPISQLVTDPKRVAVLSVDVINGFCYKGPLASPRVQGIIRPIVDLFKLAWDSGVPHIVLIQDTHDPKAVEFGQYPTHCVRGSHESETVPEIKALPFFDQIVKFEKNSISSTIDTGLGPWLSDHPEVDTFIVVGDCTDICTYLLAMDLRVSANARQLQRRVITPANAADTYDMPVETARSVGAMPHDASLLHAVFLYHMALNGVEVAGCIK